MHLAEEKTENIQIENGSEFKKCLDMQNMKYLGNTPNFKNERDV